MTFAKYHRIIYKIVMGGVRVAFNKISQTQANRLLDVVKRTLVSEINFPSKGNVYPY